jgi:hypothetical protein
MRLKCNLTVKETQSATAQVLRDLEQENKDFNVEEIFKNEDKNISGIIEASGTNNPQNS